MSDINNRDDEEYNTKRSIPSHFHFNLSSFLFASSAVYAASGYMMDQGELERGHMMSLGASMALGGLMGKRWLKTRALVPTGLLFSVGGAGTMYHLSRLNHINRWIVINTPQSNDLRKKKED